MTIVFTVLILLLGVALSGIVARISPIRLPAPLFQIALGAVLALPVFGLKLSFDPELFLLLFIPPLLFADGWRIPKREFFRLAPAILALALGLVLFTVVGVGYFIHWLVPAISLPVAFALAAVLSPTDAVAVSAIVGKGRLPSRLQHLLEGEALMNDASGLVAFKFAIAAALTGVFSLWDASTRFLVIAAGGLAVGTALGWSAGWAQRQIERISGDEPGIQVVLLILLPFAAYIFAEHFEMSGILSAVAAGMTMTYNQGLGAASSATRMQSQSLWAMLEFVFNGMTFLLLGMQLPGVIDMAHADAVAAGNVPVWHLFAYIGAITLVLVALRFVWVWVTQHFRSFRRAMRGHAHIVKPDWRLVLVTSLSGVRGSITMAGVMSVPLLLEDGTPFPARDLLIFLAMGVILCSLLGAVVTLPFLLRLLPPEQGTARQQELRSAGMRVANAAIRAIERRQGDVCLTLEPEDAAIYKELSATITGAYRRRAEALGEDEEVLERAKRARGFERNLRLVGVRAERAELQRMRERDVINDETMRDMMRETDLVETWLTKMQ
ncbi:Na+/H+ antiporter [Pigmentiphaga aceris]|uniref:Na+/H+ antiporter n=1 Tax=Pigmentiphaga aceris TaxID=1940612 RepID=A0A5C0ATJ2_9BURK|nr:Na+/H+ antiporter [Pigmentiphaga aceris]QEI05618.1 Na+/H+ antiporter [Pigmentiphaga aceris]